MDTIRVYRDIIKWGFPIRVLLHQEVKVESSMISTYTSLKSYLKLEFDCLATSSWRETLVFTKCKHKAWNL